MSDNHHLTWSDSLNIVGSAFTITVACSFRKKCAGNTVLEIGEEIGAADTAYGGRCMNFIFGVSRLAENLGCRFDDALNFSSK